MWKTKLCLGCSDTYETDPLTTVDLLADIGFEAFFVNWKPETDFAALRRKANERNMEFQSVHAPFGKAARMWEKGEAGEDAVRELLACVRDCAASEVPIMVCHAIIGFDKHTPNEIGIGNFSRVVRAAEQAGVKIAFENTEGEEYLAALMEAFRAESHVGFCWDTGHEMCYNGAKPMTALYGDRLFCTHLNDNLGVRDFGGVITPRDDLHMLPFDGAGDWQDIAHRLNLCRYDGILTFELKRIDRYGRWENEVYARMSPKDYMVEAYKRACRFAMMMQRDRGAF